MRDGERHIAMADVLDGGACGGGELMTKWRTILAYVVLTIMVALFVAGIFRRLPPVHAAPPDPVPPCEAINTTGAIIVYRCLPDEGPSYLVNSFGFMILEE